jgi:dolichol-phosphate mannosyltransferase
MSKEAVSVIIPTLNEAENIEELFKRIDNSLNDSNIPYEIIVVDDHSSDDTVGLSKSLATRFNVRTIVKKGKPGKAYSLLEGFDAAEHSLMCMIDADLQYPPEAISTMHNLLTDKCADVVLTERNDNKTGFVRKLSSKTFNLIFAKLLFGINYDTQSGLKLFRKRILKGFTLTPSPWSFDLEFLVRVLENKHSIISYGIPFTDRSGGVTKVKLLSTTLELAKASLSLRLRTSIQDVRAGHKANSRFLKRAFPGVIMTLLVSLALLVPSTKAQALTVSANPKLDIVAALMPGKTAPIHTVAPVNQPTTTASDTPQLVVAGEVAHPVVAAPVVDNAQSKTSPAGRAIYTSSTTDQQQDHSQSVISSGDTLPVGNLVRRGMTSLLNTTVNTSSLSAITATEPLPRYASAYQNTSISKNLRNYLIRFSISALVLGLGCITFFVSNRIISLTSYRRLSRQNE